MQLDILEITSGFSRWGEEAIKPILILRVVPSGHDQILIGEHHSFSCFARSSGGRQRIDARLILTSSEKQIEFAKERVGPETLRDQTMAGYAMATFGSSRDDIAALEFFLFADDATIKSMAQQMKNVGPAEITANVDVWGLEFRLPDEDIWNEPEDKKASVLPIIDYGFQITQLSTTRHEIREYNDAALDKEFLDSDDIETIKRTARRIKEDKELNPEPLLKAVKEIRFILFALAALVATLVVYVSRYLGE